MKKLILSAAILAAPAAYADTPRTVVNDAGQDTSITCGEGGELVVNGSGNKLAVTGGCARVVVNGSENTVTLDGADKIVLNGADNQVTYKRGWKAAQPRVVKTGAGNKIARAK